MLSGGKIPQDCLSWEEDEPPRKEPKKRASGSSVHAPGNKKRRMMEDLLTAANIPIIVQLHYSFGTKGN